MPCFTPPRMRKFMPWMLRGMICFLVWRDLPAAVYLYICANSGLVLVQNFMLRTSFAEIYLGFPPLPDARKGMVKSVEESEKGLAEYGGKCQTFDSMVVIKLVFKLIVFEYASSLGTGLIN